MLRLLGMMIFAVNFTSYWAVVQAHLPAIICGLGVALYPSLQLLKKAIPAVTGWKAVLVNLGMAILAVFAITPPDKFWTLAPWLSVLQMSGIAAGLHGTVAILSAQSAVAKDDGPGGGQQITPLSAQLGAAASSDPQVKAKALNTTAADPQIEHGPKLVPLTGADLDNWVPARTLRAAAVLLGALFLGGMTGCHVTAAATPATPQSIYQQGASAMDNFAIDLQQAQQIEISLHNGGAIPDATHLQIQGAFNQVAAYGIQIDALISAQASATTIAQRIQSAIASLTTISTTAAKLDAATATQVQNATAALASLLNALLPIFGVPVAAMPPVPDAWGTVTHTAAVRLGDGTVVIPN